MEDAETMEMNITELLRACGDAHHKYEEETLKGETDKEWPAWYANYLLENGIDDLFEEKLVLKDLAESLQVASVKFEEKEQEQELSWQEYYAKFLLHDFT